MNNTGLLYYHLTFVNDHRSQRDHYYGHVVHDRARVEKGGKEVA